MIAFKIALRSILKRKRRMIAIGALVVFGTLLIVFGQTFAISSEIASREAIIDHFTGDFIVYSEEASRTANPFSFTSPLPVLRDVDEITGFLQNIKAIDTYVPFAQNYCVIQIQENEEETVELPFVFYAVEPDLYRKTFQNVEVTEGSFFAAEDEDRSLPGIVVSAAQNSQYLENYGIELSPGRTVTLLSVIGGGAVNAVKADVRGIFRPRFYKNIFDYINFIDFQTYSNLFNFTGIKEQSLPSELQQDLESEEEIFSLSEEEGFGEVDVEKLETEQLSGYTLIAVKLRSGAVRCNIMQSIEDSDLPVQAVPWDEASGGFAQIATAIQTFIYVSTALIFLIVVLIFMNTLIINVIERTDEIGTIRAIGGERALIRRIFITETIITNGIAAAIGMILGLIAIIITGRTGIPLPETVSQFLVGGGQLPLRILGGPFLQAIGIILLVSVIATLYPLRFASRISPARAMEQK